MYVHCTMIVAYIRGRP